MEGFIRYLYEYKNEQRVRNVGFVKVDQGEEGGTLQIHGRGTFLNDADIRVYLVYMEGKRCYGILMGQLEGTTRRQSRNSPSSRRHTSVAFPT